MSKTLYPWNLHFWNPQQASRRLADDTMTKKEKLSYLLLFVFIYSGFIELLFISAPDTSAANGYDYASSLVAVGGAMIGLLYLYRLHKSTVSFIEKYIVVSIAATPLLVVVLITVSIFYGLGLAVVFDEYPFQTTWLDVLTEALFYGLTYWVLGRFFVTSS